LHASIDRPSEQLLYLLNTIKTLVSEKLVMTEDIETTERRGDLLTDVPKCALKVKILTFREQPIDSLAFPFVGTPHLF